MVKLNFEDLRRKKAYEEKRKIPLRLVADETGLSLSAVHKISTGEMDSIRFSTIDALCRYFGLTSIAELMEYSPDKKTGASG